jgi:hypothetical protein
MKNADTGELDPTSPMAEKSDRVVRNVLKLIEELQPKY